MTITDAVATFLNETCVTGGVKPSDPLLFTCEINRSVLLRVVLPTGDQEIISVGDTVADVLISSGFTAVSLNITEIDDSRRNFKLTLSIANASLLGGGDIMCDNTTSLAKAGCPIGKLHQTVRCCVNLLILFTAHCYYLYNYTNIQTYDYA